MATHRLASYRVVRGTTSRCGRAGGDVGRNLHRHDDSSGCVIELWLTPCLVTMPPPNATGLLVPSNERLCGTQFSHFPRGGPTPTRPVIGDDPSKQRRQRQPKESQAQCYHASSDEILYPCESVEGVVTELIGPELQNEIQRQLPNLSDAEEYPVRCPTGSAKRMNCVGSLKQNFHYLVFAVAPFYSHRQWETVLESAYREAFDLSCGVLATSLLGAGTRGIPIEEAARVAASTSVEWFINKEENDNYTSLPDGNGGDTPPSSFLEAIQFAVQDEDIAGIIDQELSSSVHVQASIGQCIGEQF